MEGILRRPLGKQEWDRPCTYMGFFLLERGHHLWVKKSQALLSGGTNRELGRVPQTCGSGHIASSQLPFFPFLLDPLEGDWPGLAHFSGPLQMNSPQRSPCSWPRHSLNSLKVFPKRLKLP